MGCIKEFLLVIFKPKEFFTELKNKINIKNYATYLIFLSIVVNILLVTRILLEVNNQNYPINDINYQLFSNFDMVFLYGIFLYFTIITLLFILYSLVISLVTKLILLMLKIKLYFNDLFKIAIYSLTPYILLEIAYLILYLYSKDRFQIYLSLIFYLHMFLLFLLGINFFLKFQKQNPKGKKNKMIRKTICCILFTLMILIISCNKENSNIYEVDYKGNVPIGKFKAAIGNDTIFTNGPDIKGIYKKHENFFCYMAGEQQYCTLNLVVVVSENVSNGVSNLTQRLGVINLEYPPNTTVLSEKLSYYLDDNELNSITIDADLRGKPINQIAIPITEYGPTTSEAKIKTLKRKEEIISILIDSPINNKN